MSDPEVAHKPRRVVRLMWWHRPAVAMLRALIGMFGFLPAPISYFIADLLALPVAAYWAITDRGGKRKKATGAMCESPSGQVAFCRSDHHTIFGALPAM